MSTPAGQDTWTTSGPYGAAVYSILVSSADPDVAWAGTQLGIFKTTNGGATWTAASNGMNAYYVPCLWQDPHDPQTLIAGVIGAGLYRSTDAGDTWVNIWSPRWGGIHCMAMDPRDSHTIYAGSYDSLYKTTNGEDWQPILTGRWDCIVLDPVSPNVLYVADDRRGVYKTTDSGQTWSAINSGLTDLHLYTLTINPLNPSTLYAGTATKGFFRTTDAGATWSPMNAGLPSFMGGPIAIDPTNSQLLYASSLGYGVYKSTDGGTTWTSANKGMESRFVRCLAIYPNAPEIIYAGTLLVGSVLKSTDGAASWNSACAGLTALFVTSVAIPPTEPETMYVSAWEEGVFKTIDGGATWTEANNGLYDPRIFSLAVDPSNSAIVYAGTYDAGVYKTVDGGANWKPMHKGLGSSYIPCVVVDSAKPSTVYAATWEYGLRKSTNGGKTWKRSGKKPGSIWAIVLDPSNTKTIYVSAWGSGVQKSMDGGKTWRFMNEGLYPMDIGIRALAISQSEPNTLYAARECGTRTPCYGAYKTTDGGANWQGMTDFGPGRDVGYSVAIDPRDPSTVYLGNLYIGVYRTTDAGATWDPINLGLPAVPVRTLAITPSGPARVFAAMEDHSLWFMTPDAATRPCAEGSIEREISPWTAR
jgi:photosystem II stability/assembly factor-like uncharacterized protein